MLIREHEVAAKELGYQLSRRDYSRLGDAETLAQLLALSIYHRLVLAPLEAGADFFTRVANRADVTKVIMGSHELVASEAARLRLVATDFKRMLTSMGIPLQALSFLTVQDFLRNLEVAMRNRNNA